MKTALLRFAMVLVGVLVAIEILERLSVTQPESWNERRMFLILLALMAGLIWSVHEVAPRLSEGWRLLCRGGLAAVLLVAAWATCFFYCWHLRPNLGWYEEPHWVAQHEVFAQEHRARIARNMW